MINVAQSIGQQVTIDIVGHGGGHDRDQKTLQLVQLRANALKQYLIAQGVLPKRIQATGTQIPTEGNTNIAPVRSVGKRAAAYFQVQLQRSP